MRVEKTATAVYLNKIELQAFNVVVRLLEDFTSNEAFSDWVEDVTNGDYPETLAESLSAILFNAKIEEDDQNF